MAKKKKKNAEKLYQFYRGPVAKPTRVADESDMTIIQEALLETATNRDFAYTTRWNNTNVDVKLAFGLASGLRYLKQKRTLALVYDETAAAHLAKYLNEFSMKLELPIIQARGLLEFAPRLKLKTLLLFSVVPTVSGDEEIYQKSGNVQPKTNSKVITSKPIDRLCQLLHTITQKKRRKSDHQFVEFRLPDIARVPVTAKSSSKKEARKLLCNKQKAETKQPHVEKSLS